MFGRAYFNLLLLSVFCFSTLFAQSKGGRWQMEANGDDTALWDIDNDIGRLQGQAAYTSLSTVPEGLSCLWLDTAFIHDYMKIEDSADLDFENENVGISMWIYPTVLNDVHFLVNKGTQTDAVKSTGYALRISLTKKIEFLIRDSNNKAQTAASGFSVPLNQWTFVAAFYDQAAGKVYFWNRVSAWPADSVNFNFNYPANDGPLSIGSWYRNDPLAPSIKDFQGGIDDVRISGRISDLIPLETGIEQPNPGLIDEAAFKIFPNPVFSSSETDLTMIFPGIASTGGTLSVFNLRGQLIHRQPVDRQPIQWRVRDRRGGRLPAGRYIIQWQTRDNLYHQSLTILN